MSEDFREVIYVRPVRSQCVHAGPAAPQNARALTEPEQLAMNGSIKVEADLAPRDFALFEPATDPSSGVVGRFWRKQDVDAVGDGCSATVTLSDTLADRLAQFPHLVDMLECSGCGREVSAREFAWSDDGERVGS